AAGLTLAPAASRRRRLTAPTFHRLAGNAERTDALLEQLLEEVRPGGERADVLLALATPASRDWETLARLLWPLGPSAYDDALAESSGDDARSARILGYRAAFDLFSCDARAALTDARAGLEHAERSGDPAVLLIAIARLVQAEAHTAEVTPGLIERGVELERSLGLRL